MQGLHSPERIVVRRSNRSVTPLNRLCADVADAAAGPNYERDRRVAEALQPYLGRSELLAAGASRCSARQYVRHLLHAGEAHTILALVWRPGQMSPVHAHRTWWMTEIHFAAGGGAAVSTDCIQHRIGDIAHSNTDHGGAHRLANLGTEVAISIHVYGVSFDRLGVAVNEIWAA